MVEPFALMAFFVLEFVRAFPLLRLLPAQCQQLIAASRQKKLCPADAVLIMNTFAISLSIFIIAYFLFLAPRLSSRIVWVDTVCAFIGLGYIWIGTANTNGYMECQGQWMRKVKPPDDICRN